jgi:hypothetical protein
MVASEVLATKKYAGPRGMDEGSIVRYEPVLATLYQAKMPAPVYKKTLTVAPAEGAENLICMGVFV